MAHYAFLDDNSIVTEVITGIDETELIEGLDPETWYGNFRGQVCKRTSYNGNYRYNYAGVGFHFDVDADAFIAPRPKCGHTELFLNHLYKWNCQKCELDAKELYNVN
jgi:ribosomal protein S27AE